MQVFNTGYEKLKTTKSVLKMEKRGFRLFFLIIILLRISYTLWGIYNKRSACLQLSTGLDCVFDDCVSVATTVWAPSGLWPKTHDPH